MNHGLLSGFGPGLPFAAYDPRHLAERRPDFPHPEDEEFDGPGLSSNWEVDNSSGLDWDVGDTMPGALTARILGATTFRIKRDVSMGADGAYTFDCGAVLIENYTECDFNLWDASEQNGWRIRWGYAGGHRFVQDQITGGFYSYDQVVVSVANESIHEAMLTIQRVGTQWYMGYSLNGGASWRRWGCGTKSFTPARAWLTFAGTTNIRTRFFCRSFRRDWTDIS